MQHIASVLREKKSCLRQNWLDLHMVEDTDMLEDEQGEFYFSESDNGEPSDTGYHMNYEKVYMPNYLKI